MIEASNTIIAIYVRMFECCAHYPTGHELTVLFDLLRKGNITSVIHQKKYRLWSVVYI